MTKREFVDALASKVDGLTKGDANVIIDAVGEVITETLLKGDSISIPNVVKFSVGVAPAREGTVMLGENKGEKWISPEHNVPRAKFSSVLKDTIKG